MADFEKGFKLVIEHEGGYVDNKFDRGGKTNWGITEKVARKYGYTGTMLDLEKETAKKIYKKFYWDKLNLDNLSDQDIANELFDTGVNMGVRVAGKFFQQSLNLLNREERNFSDVKVDGLVGHKTLATFGFLPENDKKFVLKILNILQGSRYINICERRPEQEIFIRGWLNRVF
jgi:lysozyme family protein